MHGLQKCFCVMIKRQKLLSFSLFIKNCCHLSHHNHYKFLKSKHMDSRLCFFVLALQIMSFVSGTSRPFPPNDGVGFHQQGQRAESLKVLLGSNLGSHMDSKQGIRSKGGVAMTGLKEAYYTKGLSKIGSSPPSCEHKCYGCTPCEAIQVPTTNKIHNHLGVNYANYEPEGWKCKCGPSFYSP